MRFTLLMALAACAPGLEDETFPTGSSTVAMSRDGSHALAIDVDAGRLVRVGVDGAVIDGLDLGGEPARVAPIGATGRFAVTLRASRAVAIIEDGAGLTLVDTIAVGAEPVAVVADELGQRLYVAVSTQDEVVEIDTATNTVLRRFSVGGEPRWMALRPDGRDLYVLSAFGGTASWIDLDRGRVHPVEVPDFGNLTPRFTGDPAVSADGVWLVTPALFVDNFTEEAADTLGVSLYYVSMGKWNPALVAYPIGLDGAPGDNPVVTFVSGFTDEGSVGSYAAAVALDPKVPMAYVALEGSDVVVASDFTNDSGQRDGGIGSTSMAFRATAAGPKGFAFAGDVGFVHAALDHAIQPVDMGGLREDVRTVVQGEAYGSTATPLDDGIRIADPTLPGDIERGRRLFMSATDDQIVMPGSGVSCATCHFEGRNDGLTWPLASGPRQTPSLAGRVSDTTPVTWTEDVASVAHEVGLTSGNRMGGSGLSQADADAVAAYVDWTREVDLPLKGATDAAIARGKALFEREDVGCASCHAGPALTDQQRHAVFSAIAFDTPTLRGIAATAPYAHDGRYATLGALLRDLHGQMGDTSMLSEAELGDLEAYLRSR